MRPLVTNEIKSAFIPDDRKLWTDPCLENQPWQDLDFLAWRHKIPGYYYLVIPSDGGLTGMILKMNHDTTNISGSCDLCFARNHSVGVKSALVETFDNPRVQLGIHVCADLKCSLRVRSLEEALFLYEITTVGRRIERLQEKAEKFSKRVSARR